MWGIHSDQRLAVRISRVGDSPSYHRFRQAHAVTRTLQLPLQLPLQATKIAMHHKIHKTEWGPALLGAFPLIVLVIIILLA